MSVHPLIRPPRRISAWLPARLLDGINLSASLNGNTMDTTKIYRRPISCYIEGIVLKVLLCFLIPCNKGFITCSTENKAAKVSYSLGRDARCNRTAINASADAGTVQMLLRNYKGDENLSTTYKIAATYAEMRGRF